jgi:hypothetical protein
VADHLVDYFFFGGDSSMDKVFLSVCVPSDIVEFHGDRFSAGYLQGVST